MRNSGSLTNYEFKIKNDFFNQELDKLSKKLIGLNKQDNCNCLKQLNIILKNKVKSKDTFNQIVNSLLSKILVSKIDNNPNDLLLKIYLLNSNHLFAKQNYTFKRGYDTNSTKKYKVKYQVEFYL